MAQSTSRSSVSGSTGTSSTLGDSKAPRRTMRVGVAIPENKPLVDPVSGSTPKITSLALISSSNRLSYILDVSRPGGMGPSSSGCPRLKGWFGGFIVLGSRRGPGEGRGGRRIRGGLWGELGACRQSALLVAGSSQRGQSGHFQVDTWQDSTSTLLIFEGWTS